MFEVATIHCLSSVLIVNTRIKCAEGTGLVAMIYFVRCYMLGLGRSESKLVVTCCQFLRFVLINHSVVHILPLSVHHRTARKEI